MANKPLLLMILDGWGCSEAGKGNAITLAEPHNFWALKEEYPYTRLKCSGADVGLPEGQMGNSEVGHLNMGAGRVVYQDIARISQAIKEGSFFSNLEFLRAIDYARQNNGAVHLMGLLSDGGVHSHLQHLFALLRLCKVNKVERVFIHGFLDGRDVAPDSAGRFVSQVEMQMKEIGLGTIATLSGRFYGMDRDKHWDRIEKFYQAMVEGEGRKAPNAQAAIQASYEAGILDEFIEPAVIIDEQARPVGQVEDGDSIIFFNFRADRARQITRAFTDKRFNAFTRRKWPQTYFVCMTQYDVNIGALVAFKPEELTNTLGEVLAREGLKQLRIAETEKYAHITFFFNGGVEEPNPGEDRILIPSPQVETYNLKPEMSAKEVTERLLAEIERDYYDVIILNYANPDMVGHTGVLEAAIKAVKVVDECLIKVVNKIREKGGSVIITADHGNCEMMVSPQTGGPYTAHTTGEIPLILIADKYKGQKLRDDCTLRDIAPTMLAMLNISIPEEMTGKPIMKKLTDTDYSQL